MKKLVTLSLAGSLVAGLALTGCAKQDDKPAASSTAAATTSPAAASTAKAESKVKGKITFTTNRPDSQAIFDEVAKGFHAKYPDAEVEISGIKEYQKTMKVRLASNDLPDVMYYNAEIVPTTTQWPDFFLPIDDMGYKDTTYFADQVTLDGKMYGVVEGSFAHGIVYNKKTFADAGITAVPKTLDELFDASEKLKAKSVTPIYLSFKDGWPMSYLATVAIHAAGGNPTYSDDFMKTDTPFTKTSPDGEYVNFLRLLKDKGYFEKDFVNGTYDQSVSGFISGKVGMLPYANWAFGGLEQAGMKMSDVGFFALPLDNKGKPAAFMQKSWTIGITKTSKNVETSKAFIKYLLEESNYADKVGLIPALKSKTSTIPQIKEFMDAKPELYMERNAKDITNTTTNKAQINMQDFYQGGLIAKDDAEIQKIYDDYNKKWAAARAAAAK
ncbi:hypothetical protein A8709_14325 [Paenibacillus pectinilyticus]|uniref:ABC transporter substrate-binding protein n=1 Tax=Paenibacillus pectinilyticus TaxID=512399 RepID=A0A1C1A3Y6_9BACL|nr:extracellular solute-binding protein [Paenibacillus pectinilyticus]OCT15271.1 hypothetical protein A8709_14325 [Paenibacillus pectinilyticus]